jgi:hypothetical protein
MYNALCNLHWPLLYATAWTLLSTPARRAGRVVGFAVVALTVTSDLLAAVFLPLAVARVCLRRDRYGAVLLATLVVGLGVQFGGLVLDHHPRDMGPPRSDPVWALTSFVLRPVPRMLFGSRLLPEPPKSVAYLGLVALAWLLVAGAAVVALRRRTRPGSTLAVVLFAEAAALYGESVMAGGSALARYEYAPGLMVLAAVAALLLPGRPRPGHPAEHPAGRRWAGAPAVALLALVAVVCAGNLRVDNMRAEGPSWHRSVADARAACAGRPDAATVPTAISPTQRHIAADFPCGYLRG